MAKSKATFSKKEKEKARLKKRQDKQERKEERKANARDGNNLHDMMAYIDENGNIVSAPPDPSKKVEINAEDISIDIRHEPVEADIRTGVITMFNKQKGFGFIKDSQSGDSVFVHMNALEEPVSENDKVSFEVERTFKGQNALNVKRIS